MHVAGYIVFILSVIVVSTVTPLLFSKKKVKIGWWDYTFPLLGPVLWLVLSQAGIGSKTSMVNFLLEMFFVLMVCISIPWIRFILTFAQTQMAQKISFVLTLLPMLAAVIARLCVPSLPQ